MEYHSDCTHLLCYNYPMQKASTDFSQFVALDCDRIAFIQDYLYKRDIDSVIMPVDGKNHIYVKFPSSQYNPLFKIKTVLAHYDRFPGSPGANDNSAAVFSLLEWAVRLSKVQDFHNIRLVFTDGEELYEQGISSQGAYSLAQLFKKLSIVDDDIFVFDSIGRGTIPVICESNFPELVSPAFIKKYEALENKAVRILKSAGGKWFKRPAGFSDNAGFLANGIPAVAITMLPSSEIELYNRKLMETKNSNFDIIRNSEELQPFIPETWKMFHTLEDNIENLDERSFLVMEKILDNLRVLKSVAERK